MIIISVLLLALSIGSLLLSFNMYKFGDWGKVFSIIYTLLIFVANVLNLIYILKYENTI